MDVNGSFILKHKFDVQPGTYKAKLNVLILLRAFFFRLESEFSSSCTFEMIGRVVAGKYSNML